MKRSHPKQTLAQKLTKKQPRSDPKESAKHRGYKTNQNTASTLGSRSSMDSKLTKRKLTTIQLKNSHRLQILKKRPQTGTDSTRKEQVRKFMLDLEQGQRKSAQCEEDGLISYREYCMMGDRWVPLLTPTQRERLVNPMVEKQFKSEVVENQQQNLEHERVCENEQNKQEGLPLLLEALDRRLQQNCEQFQHLPIQTKKYYSKLLKNTIQKLQKGQFEKCQSQIALESNPNTNSPNLSYQQSFNDKSPIKSLEFEFNTLPELTPPPSPIEQLIKMRELRQMGVKVNINLQSQCKQKVDTSISCISDYIKSLLFVIEQTHLCPEVVANVKMAWGFPRKQKLNRIRKGKYLGSSTEVLPQYLFQYAQDHLNRHNLYQFIHNKCIFDCINGQLNKLKPFYESNGEAFPWNFKLASPLTFFQVQESTLSYAFQDIKMKLYAYFNTLCGLIIENEQNDPGYGQLVKRRLEREDLMIRKELLGPQLANCDDNAIQNETVKVMEDVSEHIFEFLLLQLAIVL